MAHWARRPHKTDEVRRFAAKIRNGIDHWFTFTTTSGVEPTNNRAERALRERVVQRKIIGRFRNQKGTLSHETITTLLATGNSRAETIKDASEQPKPQMAKQLRHIQCMRRSIPVESNTRKSS